MPDALSQVSTRRTAQSEQADSRQIPNSAGGWTFAVDRQNKLRRFLTLGTEGGTYYIRERKLTADAAKSVIEYAQGDPVGLVDEIVKISTAGRAPRNNPALFALAVAAGVAHTEGRRYALDHLGDVARTGTHLFTFLSYVEAFRGWGRQLRRATAQWYLGKDVNERLAYQVLKYRQREGWTHRDALRLSHPAGVGLHADLFKWVTGKDADLAEVPLVRAFLRAQQATTVKQWVNLLDEFPALSWEMLPDAALNEPAVWQMLIANQMPVTALMRQLPRLTRLKVLEPMGETTKLVCAQLTNENRLHKGRVHPVNVLIALKTYALGASLRGDATWTPVREVVDALDGSFYLAYGSVAPSRKRTMLCLDVSGSMTQAVSGLALQCREAAAAIALVTAATEPDWAIFGFCSGTRGYHDWTHANAGITPLAISPRQRLDDVLQVTAGLPFGGTDCSLPMVYAREQGMKVDHFEILTDNETWAGRVHPHQALEQYRQWSGINARQSVVGMTATDFTIADPDDPGTLDVAGFDAAVPQMVADFARGDI